MGACLWGWSSRGCEETSGRRGGGSWVRGQMAQGVGMRGMGCPSEVGGLALAPSVSWSSTALWAQQDSAETWTCDKQLPGAGGCC